MGSGVNAYKNHTVKNQENCILVKFNLLELRFSLATSVLRVLRNIGITSMPALFFLFQHPRSAFALLIFLLLGRPFSLQNIHLQLPQ